MILTGEIWWWSPTQHLDHQRLTGLGLYGDLIIKVCERVWTESDVVLATHAGCHDALLPWEFTWGENREI